MKEEQEIIGTDKPLVLLNLFFIFVDDKVLIKQKANQTITVLQVDIFRNMGC